MSLRLTVLTFAAALAACSAKVPVKPVTTEAEALAIAKSWFESDRVPPEALRVKRSGGAWEVTGPSPDKIISIDAETGAVSADIVVEGYIKTVGE